MDRIVSISEARATLGDLTEEAREREVYLLKHGRPVAVLVSVEAYERLQERLEDLEDTLAVLQADHSDTIPFTPTGGRRTAAAG